MSALERPQSSRSAASALALCSVVLLSVACAQREAPRPNVLFVLFDQLRSDVLSSAGHPIVATPNLDRLAAEGVFFPNTYVQAPVCIASRASIFSARYPSQISVWDNFGKLGAEQPTWPAHLRDNGYRTLALGKTHHVAGGAERVAVQIGASFEREFATYRVDQEVPVHGTSPVAPEDFFDARIADAAIESLHELSAGAQPWALFVGIHAPHPPLYPPAPYDSMYAGRGPELPDLDPERMRARPGFQARAWENTYEPRSAAERSELVEHYWALVTFADLQLGRILDALDELELAEDTLVVVTSDHGDTNGEHGIFGKFKSFYEGEVKVPGLLRLPGSLPSARRVEAPIEALDLTGTLYAVLGVEPSPGCEGRDLRALIDGDASAARPFVYSTLFLKVFRERGMMLRRGDWKLHWYANAPAELYELASDPGELDDRSEDPAAQGVRRELEGLLLSRLVHNFPREAPPNPMALDQSSYRFGFEPAAEGGARAWLQRGELRITSQANGALSISRPNPGGSGRQRLGDSLEELQQHDELVQLLGRHLALARQPRNGMLGVDAAERRGG